MAEADTEAVRGGTEVPCSDFDSTPKGLQKLCEQLIASRRFGVLALNDRACVYYRNRVDLDAVCITRSWIWSFRVELFGIVIKVSNPRRLWKLIHSRYKEVQEVEHARSVIDAIEHAREVVKKDDGKD